MNNAPFSFRRLGPDHGSLEMTEEYIRLRAYQLWEQRGRQEGHEVEDWLQAEAEVFGNKAQPSADWSPSESKFTLANPAA
jgi:hypothetical protein